MKANSKSIRSIFLILIICLSSLKSQEANYYEKLKEMAQKETAPDHSIGADGKKRELSKEDKELYNKPPVYPMLTRRFFCDIDVKTNTVKQDVMKNHNYSK